MPVKRDSEGFKTLGDYDPKCKHARDFQLPENLDDVSEVVSMSLEAMKHNAGRPATYEDSAEGLQRFYDRGVAYFERLNQINSRKNPDNKAEKLVLPDFESFAIWAGISRNTLFNYENRNARWNSLIGMFKQIIIAARKQAASTYKTPVLFEVFNLVNNQTGYVNTSEIKHSVEVQNRNIDDIQTEDALSSAGLIYDAHSGEYIPMIGTTAEGGEDI